MKIQLLTQFFDPEPTLKGLTFAKGLQDRGHEVRVVTGFPNYPSGRLAEGYRLRLHATELMDSVPVDRVILYPSHDRSIVRRLANYGSFAVSSAAFAVRGRWHPDLTWVHHPPPTAATAALLDKRIRNVPFVLEIQDLWPDSLAATGMVSGQRVLRPIDRGMRSIYGHSSGLICISHGFARRLEESGVPSEKLTVIHNWADERRLQATQKDRQWAAGALDRTAVNVLYAGNMGPAQALEAVLAATALATRQVHEIRLHMVGDGLDLDRLQSAAARDIPGIAVFHGRQSMGRVAALAELCDFGLVHLKDDPLFEITLPSKTQANMFLGLPMVVAVRGDAASLVAEAGAGLAAEPEGPDTIAHAMVDLAEMGRDGRREMGLAGRRYYMAHLSVAAGLTRYEALFTGIKSRMVGG